MLIPWRVTLRLSSSTCLAFKIHQKSPNIQRRFPPIQLPDGDLGFGFACKRVVIYMYTVWKEYTTPLKIKMEHNYGGLEYNFPFSMGDLYVPC